MNSEAPSFFDRSIVRAEALISGKISMGGFVFVGLNLSDYTFQQWFMMGSIPGMPGLRELLGLWLLVTAGASGPTGSASPELTVHPTQPGLACAGRTRDGGACLDRKCRKRLAHQNLTRNVT